jgi:hypothetical protein
MDSLENTVGEDRQYMPTPQTKRSYLGRLHTYIEGKITDFNANVKHLITTAIIYEFTHIPSKKTHYFCGLFKK